MTQLLSIQDDKIVIKTLVLESTSGAVKHDGDFAVCGAISVGKDLTVTGTINAGTVKVKNLITESGTIEGVGQWTTNLEEDLNGKGFGWTWGNGTTRLMYRNGGRIWTNGDVDLDANKSFKIDNVAVLSLGELGSQIKKSSLTELGTLKSLDVTGHVSLGDFIFFNPTVERLGVGTQTPNGSLGIVSNGIEIVVDSISPSHAIFGTYTNHDFSIISDSTPRITVKNNGEVHVGDEQSKSGVMRIFGSLYVDNLVADNRVERTSPLEFKADKDSNIYGKGLIWSGNGANRQFVMRSNPDRLWSSESIDLNQGQQYHINGVAVLSAESLGSSIVHSNLISVGPLQSLTVQGSATFINGIKTSSIESNSVVSNQIQATDTFTINVNNIQTFYSDNNEIEIGNKNNLRKPVKVFGPLSVGINNPDPTLGLAVNGDVSFSDKRFTNGTGAPTTGTFTKGDICWNTTPQEYGYIGWVCVADGTPGTWLPFGAISRQ